MKKFVLIVAVLFTTGLLAKEGMYLYASDQKIEKKESTTKKVTKIKGCYIY